MSTLRQALTDYLAMRRALGYKLDKTERLLGQFVSFAEDRGEKCLTPKRRWPGQLSRQAPTQADDALAAETATLGLEGRGPAAGMLDVHADSPPAARREAVTRLTELQRHRAGAGR